VRTAGGCDHRRGTRAAQTAVHRPWRRALSAQGELRYSPRLASVAAAYYLLNESRCGAS
jgi:hypothetical protein